MCAGSGRHKAVAISGSIIRWRVGFSRGYEHPRTFHRVQHGGFSAPRTQTRTAFLFDAFTHEVFREELLNHGEFVV